MKRIKSGGDAQQWEGIAGLPAVLAAFWGGKDCSLSYTETSSFLEFERMAPIFRPEVINKIQNRVMGSAQTRRNPTSLLNRGRPTTGANATATTNPTGAQTQQSGSSAARGVSGTLQSIAGGMNAYDDFGSSLSRIPQPSTRIGKAAPGANGAGISGESPFPAISSGIQNAYNRFSVPGIVGDGLQGASSALNEFDNAVRPPIQNIGAGVDAGMNAFHRTDSSPAYGSESGYAAPGAGGAGVSGRPLIPSGIGWGGMMSRGGAVPQQAYEPTPFANAGTPQYQGGGMKMGGNEDVGGYESGIFYGADKPFLPRVNLQDPQYQMQGLDMAGNPVRPSGGGLGPFADSARAYSDPQNPRLVEPDMSGAPKVDYFGNRDRRPRQIDRPLTPREAQDVNTEMAGTRELTDQMADFIDQGRSSVPLVPNSPLQSNGQDPRIAAMEAESRRISRQGSILENSDIATSSGQARQNFQNLPSDMQQDAVATIPSQGYNGNIGYANDPDRYDPTDPGAQRQQEANARATTQGRVRPGNDAFGDRFRGGALDDYASTGMTWQEREKAAEEAADAPRRAKAAAVAREMSAERQRIRDLDPEAEYARKLSIAQASADREAKHNVFKEKSGGLNYKQLDRLTRKTDLIEKKVGQGRITRAEADRQIGNITDVQNRRAEGASSVAAERLRRMESQKPMDRTRLPNGSLPEATRMKAEQTANQLTDPNYTKGSPEFNQSREVLSSVGVDSADSAASASKKISGTPFPMEDPEAARRAAMAYRMYWGSKKDASKDFVKDDAWGSLGFASGKVDPQFAKMMDELTSTSTKDLDKWIEKYSGHLAMFGEGKSQNTVEQNAADPGNVTPFPGRFGGY